MSKKSFWRYIGFLAVLAVVYYLFSLTHRFVVVSGESMLPTLLDGQIIVASEATQLIPGHIYMFQEPEEELYAIKRLIGIPGDTIELRDGATYRNGEEMMPAPGDSWDNETYSLGPDEYFFLGDNRGVSYDGRYWARHVKREEILYQLDFVIYPFISFGKAVNL